MILNSQCKYSFQQCFPLFFLCNNNLFLFIIHQESSKSCNHKVEKPEELTF